MSNPMPKGRKAPMMGMKSGAKKGTFKRILKMLFSEFIIEIKKGIDTDWNAALPNIIKIIAVMGCIYLVGVIASFFHARIMAIVTQGFLNNTRKTMFRKMERLPIKYFDTHPHFYIIY